jgi:hypothetical protein
MCFNLNCDDLSTKGTFHWKRWSQKKEWYCKITISLTNWNIVYDLKPEYDDEVKRFHFRRVCNRLPKEESQNHWCYYFETSRYDEWNRYWDPKGFWRKSFLKESTSWASTMLFFSVLLCMLNTHPTPELWYQPPYKTIFLSRKSKALRKSNLRDLPLVLTSLLGEFKTYNIKQNRKMNLYSHNPVLTISS